MSTLGWNWKRQCFFYLFSLISFFVAQQSFKQCNFVIWDMCVLCHIIRLLLVLWNLEDFVLVSPESQTIFANTLSEKVYNFYDNYKAHPSAKVMKLRFVWLFRRLLLQHLLCKIYFADFSNNLFIQTPRWVLILANTVITQQSGYPFYLHNTEIVWTLVGAIFRKCSM